MKLPERFRSDEAIDPQAEAELAVIDAALSGGPVPADSEQLAQFARELRAERAETTPALAAQLDRWAASGFAKAERRKASPGSEAAQRSARFAGIVPRGLIAPVGAVATLAVVVGIAISSGGLDTGGDQDQSSSSDDAATETFDESGGAASAPETGAAGAEDSARLLEKSAPEGDLQAELQRRSLATTARSSTLPARCLRTSARSSAPPTSPWPPSPRTCARSPTASTR